MKKSKITKNKLNSASLLVRLLSTMIDLSLSYLLYSFLLSFEFFSKIYQKLFLLFAANFNSHVEVYISFFLLYFIFFTLSFYSTLFFGNSLGQLVIGIDCEGKGVAKRWKGSLRVLIDFLTAPFFFVTNFPLLLKKRSIKEKLSQSNLNSKFNNDKKRISIAAAVLLFLILLQYFTPLLTNQKFLSKIEVKESKIEPESLSSKSDFSRFRLTPSNLFSLASFSSLKNEQIVIVPQYEKIRRETIYTFKPKVLFYDLKSSQFIHFTQAPHFSWRQVLTDIKSYHPLFSFYYPALEKLLDRKKDYAKTKYEGETREKKFTKDIELELKRLVKSSFEINFKNSHRQFFSHGPFLKSNFVLKNFFLNMLDGSYPVDISIVEIGNYNFLSLTQIIEHIKERQEHFISLSAEHADHYILSSGVEEEALTFVESFKKVFMGEIEFFGDYTNVFKLQDFLKDRKDLMIYDVFLNEQIPLEERPVYAREMEEYFKEKMKNCAEDKQLLKACHQMMSDFKQAYNYFEDKYPEFWRDNFLEVEKKSTQKRKFKKSKKRRK